MKNVFQRAIDLSSLKDLELSEYTPEQLTAYVTTIYPGDPVGALKVLVDNHEIGSVLYNTTKILVEGLRSDKGN